MQKPEIFMFRFFRVFGNVGCIKKQVVSGRWDHEPLVYEFFVIANFHRYFVHSEQSPSSSTVHMAFDPGSYRFLRYMGNLYNCPHCPGLIRT